MITRTKCKEEMGFGEDNFGGFPEAFNTLLHESFFLKMECA